MCDYTDPPMSYNEEFYKAYCEAVEKQRIQIERTPVPEVFERAFKEGEKWVNE